MKFHRLLLEQLPEPYAKKMTCMYPVSTCRNFYIENLVKFSHIRVSCRIHVNSTSEYNLNLDKLKQGQFGHEIHVKMDLTHCDIRHDAHSA